MYWSIMARSTGKSYLSLMVMGIMLMAMSACRSGSQPTTPIAPVSIEVNLNAYAYRALLSPGGMVRITQPQTRNEFLGYGGLLLVRSLTETTFYAYDLSCPVENSHDTRIELIDLSVRCPSCGSQFDVLYGSGAPTSGVARVPLRQYRTHYNASLQRLFVTN